jgi:hypothetical protein
VAALRKKASALLLAIIVLVSILFQASVNVALAKKELHVDVFPKIVISTDGSMSPETDFISRNGSTYILTADMYMQYSVEIRCSNIVFDGAGHKIADTSDLFRTYNGTNYCGEKNIGLVVNDATNVTVKNLNVSSYSYANADVMLDSCSNCTVLNVTTAEQICLDNSRFNVIEGCNIGPVTGILYLYTSSNNNLIIHNNIANALFLLEVNSNIVTENNITAVIPSGCMDNLIYGNVFSSMYSDKNTSGCLKLTGGLVNFWDNGSVGNYWSDYSMRYPNASEAGNSGIGDTPFVIDANNIDHYPLMAPRFEQEINASSSQEPQPPTGQLTTRLMVGAIGVLIAGIATGLVYFKMKKRS